MDGDEARTTDDGQRTTTPPRHHQPRVSPIRRACANACTAASACPPAPPGARTGHRDGLAARPLALIARALPAAPRPSRSWCATSTSALAAAPARPPAPRACTTASIFEDARELPERAARAPVRQRLLERRGAGGRPAAARACAGGWLLRGSRGGLLWPLGAGGTVDGAALLPWPAGRAAGRLPSLPARGHGARAWGC